MYEAIISVFPERPATISLISKDLKDREYMVQCYVPQVALTLEEIISKGYKINEVIIYGQPLIFVTNIYSQIKNYPSLKNMNVRIGD